MAFQIARTAALTALFTLAAGAAQAHHAMGFDLPATLTQGLLSGLGHPVLGLDHLAFIVAAGMIAGAARLGWWLPVLFVAASLGGVVVHLFALDLPAAELVIAASVVLAGILLVRGRDSLGRSGWAGLFVLVGLFHGYAYGESIVGAEPTPLAAYFVGLLAIQSGIGVGVALLAGWRGWSMQAMAPRLAGAAVFGIGLSALAGQVIPG